ncbi:MAG: DUF58 domain-containing protein [Candidatus Solibacter usitatus]|nr:DUF58 domain-containing protein [Candidatus Solibacter usitatus]
MSKPLLDRGFLERLERLTIHWVRSFPGLVGGHNKSRFAGSGQEFLDHRHFHHGDDLRAVNWRAYMRLEKLFLKMFQVEPRVPVRILLDTSASMESGESAELKFQFARRLAGALAYVGLVRLENITIQPFSDVLWDAHQCGGGRHRFAPASDFLSGLKAHGRTRFFEVAKEFVGVYPSRGMLIIISDFFGDQAFEKPLQYLSDLGHELLLLHIWNEEDRVPPWNGEIEVVDAESGEKLELSFEDDVRTLYTERFDDYSRGLRELALRKGGRYVGLSTRTPVEEVVFGPLSRVEAVY